MIASVDSGRTLSFIEYRARKRCPSDEGIEPMTRRATSRTSLAHADAPLASRLRVAGHPHQNDERGGEAREAQRSASCRNAALPRSGRVFYATGVPVLPMVMCRAHVVLLLGWLSLWVWLGHVGPARAQTRPALAGRWSAGVLVERWNVGAWGEACGPHPADRTLPGGEAYLRQEGTELVITGGGAYRTDECWEKLPGVARTSHSVSDHTWKTRCTSAANNPRRAVISTTLSESDTAIRFDETGEYQFVIQNQNCSAAVRRNRTYLLLPASGEPPRPPVQPTQVETASQPASVPDPAGHAERNCATPGDPARVEVKPAHKILRPGDRFSFRASVLDARGCPVDVKPNWSLVTAPPGISLAGAGSVVAADGAGEGRAELLVAVGGRGAHVFVDVVSPDRYAGLLREMQGDAGEPDDVAVGVVSAPALGGATAVAEDTARKRKAIFVGVVAVLAAALGVFGFAMLRRAKSPEPPVPVPPGGSHAPPYDPASFVSAPPRPSGAQASVVPGGASGFVRASSVPAGCMPAGSVLAGSVPAASPEGYLAAAGPPAAGLVPNAPPFPFRADSPAPATAVSAPPQHQPHAGPPYGSALLKETLVLPSPPVPSPPVPSPPVPSPPVPSPPATPSLQTPALGPRPKTVGAVCPTCRQEFPPGSGFCPHDGTPLLARPAPPPPPTNRPPSNTANACPICHRAYAPGHTRCAADGAELVPDVVLAPAEAQDGTSGLAKRGKICPTCGARFDSAASFCGKDGTALVLVN